MLKRSRVQVHEFNVAWICALQVEVDAARVVLDEEYDDIHEAAEYILGQIGRHNVVILCPPAGQIGIGAAAVRAERLNSIFPAIKHWLMVGVGGGVPNSTADIRLGDVVISQPQGAFGGVVQYDMGKTGPGNEHLRTGSLNAPPQDLLAAITKFRSNVNIGKSDLKHKLSQWTANGVFKRPSSASDVLFAASYEHKGGSICSECSSEQLSFRKDRPNTEIQIHYGLIASGNRVIKDGVTRDVLAEELGGVLCFEMEAAGLMNSFPCLVIRGICDYADSHKNKSWQPFAAIAAASCARDILSCVSIVAGGGDIRPEFSQPNSSLPSCTATQTEPDEESPGHSTIIPGSQQTQTDHLTLANCTLSHDERQLYFESLRFDQLESRHLSVKTAHSRTCRWLLQRHEFRDWLDTAKMQQHGGFLWIKGKAASGKSTIMKFLLSHVKKTKASDIIVAFFFNARGVAIEQTTRGMYQSLLYQLLEQCPDLKSVFDSRTVKVGSTESVDWSIETLQVLFNVAVERLGRRSLMCLVDALDECDDDEVQNMVRFFEDLSHAAIASGVAIRVLFSSRHYPYISVEMGISLVLEDQAEHDGDIISYLESELKAGQSQKARKIREEILQRASGIFLWVVLVVDILNTEYRRGRIHAMERRLKEVPDGVERLFDDILNRGGSCSAETATCIQWVLFAKKPLKLEELYFAMMTFLDSPASMSWDPSELTREDMERYVLDASRGLLEETRSRSRTVQFIHECVREFFLKGKGLCRPPFAPADTFPARSHEMLKSCCNSYLNAAYPSLHVDSVDPCLWDQFSERRERAVKTFPLLEYASRGVLFHSNAAERLGICQTKFISSVCRTVWLEVANLLERYDVRRYPLKGGFLHALADQDLVQLAKIELSRETAWEHLDLNHFWLILAGMASVDDGHLSSITECVTGKWKGVHDIGSFISRSNIIPDFSHSDEAVRAAIRSLREHRRSISERVRRTPLSWALRNGHMTMVRLLVLGEPVLLSEIMISIQTGKVEVLRVLLPHFDIFQSAHLQNVFKCAGGCGNQDINAYLVSVLASSASTSQVEACLSNAAWLGHDNLVESLLKLPDIDINAKGVRNETPLARAAAHGHVGVVRLLLADARIDVNRASDNSPLIQAITEGELEVVRLLLDHSQIDVNRPQSDGHTPLYHVGVNSGTDSVDLLRGLLRHKSFRIDVNERSLQYFVYQAIWFDQVELVKAVLEECGLSLDLPILRDLNPIHTAARYNCPRMLEFLLPHCDEGQINLTDEDGRTPYQVAFARFHPAAARLIEQHGGR